MRFPRALARFNKRVTNRVQGTWSWALPPWAVVVHRGRRTGRTYHTPVIAYTDRQVVVIAVMYGEESDWVRNLLAAKGGALTRRGRTLVLTRPRIVAGADAAALPLLARPLARVARSVLVADLGGVLARGTGAGVQI